MSAVRTPQRCACGGIVGPEGECAACRSRRLAREARQRQVAPPIVHDVLRSQGRPLEPGVQADMEARLGHDFSQVRVHDDERAARSTAAVGARAYTVGRNVVLGTTRPSPSLLAHELAHVVQQGARPAPHGDIEIGQPGDAYEREADTAARRPAGRVSQRAPPSVQRQPEGSGSGGTTVFLCSKALETSPAGTHAFFRIGGGGTGNPTYSLEPENRSGHGVVDLTFLASGCWQGQPKRNFPEDVDAADAHCAATSLTESCIASAFAAYPIGKYCTRGPNSNTFAGHLARRCGMVRPDPWGWNPGIDDSPPAAGTYAPRPAMTAVTCMENDCLDLSPPERAELTSSPPVVARQHAGQPQPTAQCALSCTDPQFIALDRAGREAQLAAQCPQGFTASATRFFGEAFPAQTGATLRTRMLAAQAPAMREMCLNGRDPTAYRLPGTLGTYPGHSPGESKAVDVDAHGQPYLMHELTRSIPGDPKSPMVPEADIDNETRPVFVRAAFWANYRRSLVPSGITSVSRVPGGGHLPSERQWTNPVTGTREQTTVGALYDLLNAESHGIQEYFALLAVSDDELRAAVEAFVVYNTRPASELMRLGLPADWSATSVAAFQRRVADDYRLVGGSAARLAALAGRPTPSTTAPSHLGDRPFAGRQPELGFLTLPREVIVALTDQGLTWGAIDFGAGSGDVMHIDCRGLLGC